MARPSSIPLIVAAFETGMRKGNFCKLRWRDVHWEHDVLLLQATISKTDTARDVPMTQPVKAVLSVFVGRRVVRESE